MGATAGWHIWSKALARTVAGAGLCLLSALPVLAERLAFVVGNGAYDVAADLANPVNDATAVADALRRLDFNVTLMTDAAGDSLWAAMDDFVTKAEGAESVVFYYSGHAFQMSGVNYLVPVSAKLESRDAAKTEAWSLDGIIARLQSRNRQTLIFLDACRNDPLPAGVRGSGAAADGLARVQTGVGTFVAFATEPGGVTVDGIDGAKNSPFTAALLDHIEKPGKSISDMMIEVRNTVENATLRKQVPWDQSSLREQFYFVPPDGGGKQELSEADYELLAQLSPDDRKQFLDLLAQSGFDEASLGAAEAEISLAEANLVQVAAESSVVLGAVSEGPELSLDDLETTADDSLVATPSAEAEPEGPASLDDLAVLESAVDIGAAGEETVVAALDPAKEEDPDAPIRLAALNWATRDIGLNGVTVGRLRLAGRLINKDNDEGRAILASIDPRLLEDEAAPAIAPEDLALAIQGELKRVGCYQMKVDGDWGKGSKTALTSYYLAKKIVPKTLEPTPDLFAGLQTETKVVCEVRVAKSAVKTGKRAQVVLEAESSDSVERTPITSKKKTGRKQETSKTRITKGTIGITGSF
jgi:uncharacterized caspase-like protein